MTIPYNLNIPQASADPSATQPLMQTNFNSISSIWQSDHYTFSDATAGEHKQITLPVSVVPTTPATTYVPTLFTMPVSAVDQLFFYTGTQAQSQSQYTANANGSTMALGGTILKWGNSGTQVGDNATITFASPFPTTCYCVLLTLVDSTQKQTFVNVKTTSSTNFTVRVIKSNGSSDVAYFNYIAIGA